MESGLLQITHHAVTLTEIIYIALFKICQETFFCLVLLQQLYEDMSR